MEICIFSISHNVFYPFWNKFLVYINISDLAKMMILVFNRVENNCGNWKKCWLPSFSLFLTMFSKGFFLTGVKIRDCVEKGKANHILTHCLL